MFIYITTCLINGKKYIGKYEGKESDDYLGSGKLLRRAIKKYGKCNFTRTILQRYSTKEDVRLAEIKYIKIYNAVQSDEFYNIANGGEGGNTFAGIVGEERVKLINKLKMRKKGNKSSYKNKTTTRNLITGEVEIIPIPSFLASSFHVGIACKGIYTTPFGNFSSTSLMERIVGIDYTSLVKHCKNNMKLIRKAHFQNQTTNTIYYDHLKQFVGETFDEAGFNFTPINDVLYKNLDFYINLTILK
jgi:hypothetical protein